MNWERYKQKSFFENVKNYADIDKALLFESDYVEVAEIFHQNVTTQIIQSRDFSDDNIEQICQRAYDSIDDETLKVKFWKAWMGFNSALGIGVQNIKQNNLKKPIPIKPLETSYKPITLTVNEYRLAGHYIIRVLEKLDFTFEMAAGISSILLEDYPIEGSKTIISPQQNEKIMWAKLYQKLLDNQIYHRPHSTRSLPLIDIQNTERINGLFHSNSIKNLSLHKIISSRNDSTRHLGSTTSYGSEAMHKPFVSRREIEVPSRKPSQGSTGNQKLIHSNRVSNHSSQSISTKLHQHESKRSRFANSRTTNKRKTSPEMIDSNRDFTRFAIKDPKTESQTMHKMQTPIKTTPDATSSSSIKQRTLHEITGSMQINVPSSTVMPKPISTNKLSPKTMDASQDPTHFLSTGPSTGSPQAVQKMHRQFKTFRDASPSTSTEKRILHEITGSIGKASSTTVTQQPTSTFKPSSSSKIIDANRDPTHVPKTEPLTGSHGIHKIHSPNKTSQDVMSSPSTEKRAFHEITGSVPANVSSTTIPFQSASENNLTTSNLLDNSREPTHFPSIDPSGKIQAVHKLHSPNRTPRHASSSQSTEPRIINKVTSSISKATSVLAINEDVENQTSNHNDYAEEKSFATIINSDEQTRLSHIDSIFENYSNVAVNESVSEMFVGRSVSQQMTAQQANTISVLLANEQNQKFKSELERLLAAAAIPQPEIIHRDFQATHPTEDTINVKSANVLNEEAPHEFSLANLSDSEPDATSTISTIHPFTTGVASSYITRASSATIPSLEDKHLRDNQQNDSEDDENVDHKNLWSRTIAKFKGKK